MTSYTSSNRFAMMVTADPAVTNQWGTVWDNTVSSIDQAVSGNTGINIAGLTTYSLTVANNAPDQARQGLLPFTGALTATCTVMLPQVPKIGFVWNQTTGGQLVVLTTGVGGGRTIAVPPGLSTFYSCDGTNIDAPTIIGNTPVGGLMPFAGSVPPSRWLLCFGQAVSRTTYALLFAVIGTVYGAGDGSTTFNLPDARGRSLSGLDNMGGVAAGRITSGNSAISGVTLGATGGDERLPNHNHGLTDPGHTHTVSDPGHVHGVNDPTHAHGVSDPGHNHGVNDPGHGHGVYDPQHTHTSYVPNWSTLYGQAGGYGFNPWAGSWSFYGTTASATNISIYGSGTGIYLSASGTGIGIYGNYTGISIQAAGTGITNQSHTTGITIAAAGAGSAANMPPTLMTNTIIYAGA